MLALSIGIALALGWAGVRLFLGVDSLQPGWAARLMEVALGAGFGAGLTSSTFFLLLLAGAPGLWPVVSVELILLLSAAGLLLRRARRRAPPAPLPEGQPATGWNRLLALALLAGTVLAGAAFFEAAGANPYGEWDAWSIWNVRAKFLAAPGDAWKYAYSPLLRTVHPDYPLLVSGFVARCWKYAGATPASAPLGAAFLFQFAVVALLVSGVAVVRGASAGLLAGLVLLASTNFLAQGASQYADVPLSLYAAGSLGLLLVEAKMAPRRRAVLALAGLFAGFGAWTKNEGLLFLGLLAVSLLLVQGFVAGWKEAFRKCAWFLLGASPPLLLTLSFKLFMAPAADPMLAQSVPKVLEKLRDAGRYVVVLKAFFTQALAQGEGWAQPVVLLAILAIALRFEIGRRLRPAVTVAGLTLALLAAGYFGAYVVTPYDLRWHLGTSLGRLYAQIWPSFLLLSFSILRRPEDLALLPAPGKRKKKKRARHG